MNAAAYQRLQHRMESRGRVAGVGGISTCQYVCNCTRHNLHESHRNDEENIVFGGVNVVVPRSLSPKSQAWLLKRAQGVEVDITGGGVDHRRHLPCCFLCCNGYHHMQQTQRGILFVDEGKNEKKNEEEKKEAVSMDLHEKQVDTYVAKANIVSSTTQVYHPPESTGNGVKEATSLKKLQGVHHDPPFNPAKASVMLSSFIRLAESLPSQLTLVDNNRDHMEKSNDNQPHHNIPAAEHSDVSNVVADNQQLTHMYETPGVPPPFQSMIRSSVSCAVQPFVGSSSAIIPENKQCCMAMENNGGQEKGVGTSDGVPAMKYVYTTGTTRSILNEVSPPFVARPAETSANSSPPNASTSTSAPGPAAVTQQSSVPQFNDSSKANVFPSVSVLAPMAHTSSAEYSAPSSTVTPPPGTSPTVQPTLNSSVEPAGNGVTSVITSAPQPQPSSGLSPVVMSSGPTATQTATTVSFTDPTPANVINALREKLLLENTDAYVRSLEKQQQADEQLAREQEEQRRSQNLDHIMTLLTRLREDDQEVLEAMYESIIDESVPVTPTLIPIKERPILPPLRLTTNNTAPSSSSVPPFPVEVMTAYKMETPKPQPQQTISTQVEPPLPLPKAPFRTSLLPREVTSKTEQPPPLSPPPVVFTSPPTPEAQSASTIPGSQFQQGASAVPPVTPTKMPWGLADGTTKAWVDHHFGSTLDPQHRELLHHVLLSREAEVRRVAAMELQCKELEAKLHSARSADVSVIAGEAFSKSLHQWQEERDKELRKVLALLHTKEEEIATVRKTQQEQKAKIEELTESMRPRSARVSGTVSREEEEEIRRWKMRCETIEQQHRFSVRRLEELQTYIEQLRNGAQQAVMNMTLSNPSPRSVPINTGNVHFSSASTSLPASRLETATPHSTVSATYPFTDPYYSTSPHMNTGVVNAAAPQQQSLPVNVPATLQPPVNSFASSTVGVGRAAALKQLREDLEVECGRFADETRRWNQYVKSQEERWSQIYRQ